MKKLLIIFCTVFPSIVAIGQHVEWMASINTNKDSLYSLYHSQAVIITTKAEITNDYLPPAIQRITQISIIANFTAGSNEKYTYEIGEVTTSDSKKFKHLLILEGNIRKLQLLLPSGKNISVDPGIDESRKQWMQYCNAHQVEKLINQVYSTDAIYYNHRPVIRGTDAIIAEYQYMTNPQYRLTLTSLHVEMIDSHNAFEIGQCSGSYNDKYILWWQKDKDGKWKIKMDSNV